MDYEWIMLTAIDKTVYLSKALTCMNMNYKYLTTIYRSILTQIYVFLVLITIFHFDHEKFISKKCNKYFFTGNLHIWAKILLGIVVG